MISDVTTTYCNEYTVIRKDYIPRDKVNEIQILSLIGARYKHKHGKIQEEMFKCQQMKSKFLNLHKKSV